MNFLAKTLFFAMLSFTLALAAAPAAKADPLSFSNVMALQNNGSARVDLFSHPGTTLVGSQLSFLVDVTGTLPDSDGNILLATYTEAGRSPVRQSFKMPMFGAVAPPFTLLFTVASLVPANQGAMATLTLDIMSGSNDFLIPSGPDAGNWVNGYTYSFQVQPVPEPTTILLFSTGLLGLVKRLRKKRKPEDFQIPQ
jgi:hypothetical protein